MKSITFRPLRRNSKNGKIIVASYTQWRSIKSADEYDRFQLLINDEYKGFDKNEYVHNHKGELIFWFNHTKPEELPKNFPDIEAAIKYIGVDRSYFEGEEWRLTEPLTEGFHWSVQGFDCDGVPVFSHNTQSYVAEHYKDMSVFEPLTVGLVVTWLGWFLYQLNNSYLKIGK